jgi:hypothetical protein
VILSTEDVSTVNAKKVVSCASSNTQTHQLTPQGHTVWSAISHLHVVMDGNQISALQTSGSHIRLGWGLTITISPYQGHHGIDQKLEKEV